MLFVLSNMLHLLKQQYLSLTNLVCEYFSACLNISHSGVSQIFWRLLFCVIWSLLSLGLSVRWPKWKLLNFSNHGIHYLFRFLDRIFFSQCIVNSGVGADEGRVNGNIIRILRLLINHLFGGLFQPWLTSLHFSRACCTCIELVLVYKLDVVVTQAGRSM